MNKMSIEEVKSRINPFSEFWKNIDETNCLAYALGLDIPQSEICECAYQIGQIYRYYNEIKKLYCSQLELLELELKFLGIKYEETSVNSPLGDDEWKIFYLGNDYESGFHFLRQTKNGIWMHKPDFGIAPTNNTKNGHIITDPRQVIPYYKILEKNKCYKLKK